MQSFAIAPAASKGLWFLPLILLVVLVPVLFALQRSLAASKSAHFDVSSDGLSLVGDWYGRTIASSQIRRDEVRRVDFGAEPGLLPGFRTLGSALPGYQSGWFRLKNGERALLYLTDRSRVVYVPTTDGYSLLVSPTDPDGFVAAVRTIAR